ncbi:MAG: methionine--tRNA ligase [Acidimicrobiia bacterium]|nr:methionine--tRNA ligase [Acidimicrobiia bacterium]
MSNSFYVTTPIYYVNDAPHIGHAYTTIHADVLARWRRLHGDDVLFLTGTDEHGLKIQRAAEERGVTPLEWADTTSARFRAAWELLDISNDDFIRTTEDRHHVSVQAFLQQVYDNGFIELATYEGLYCVACEAYYVDDDLIDGLCPIHHRPVERVTEENYFFQLSRFEQPLLDYYDAHPEAVRPEGKRNEVLGFIKQGLRDFSMSRTSISWGIPLPWDPDHVTYVWYDALINYATAVGFGADPEQFARRWPAQYHLLAKDILRFHAVYWPAMLMAAGLPLPECVFAHGYLLVGGEKMSKTSLNNIAPADLVPEFGSDGFRYHFVTDVRFGQDGDFSYEGMVARYNADLANNFGNLASRVLNMAVSYCDGRVPEARADGPLAAQAAVAVEAMELALADLNYADGFGAVWQLIRDANSYIEDSEPWKSHKAGEAAATAAMLGDCLEALRIVALLASPVIPRAAADLWSRLGLAGAPEEQRLPEAVVWGSAPTAGNALVKGAALFPRLEPIP